MRKRAPHRGQRTTRVMGLLGAVMVVTAACSGSTADTTTTTEATTTTTAAADTTTTDQLTTTSQPSTTTTTGGPITTIFRGRTVVTSDQQDGDQGGQLVTVTVEDHDGFTRVVFEFNGPGTPFWQVGPTQRPFFIDNDVPADRDVAGTEYIAVRIYPGDVGDAFTGPLTIEVPEGPIAEVAFLGTSDVGNQNDPRESNWIIGTRGEKAFLGATYREPARLELDIGD